MEDAPMLTHPPGHSRESGNLRFTTLAVGFLPCAQHGGGGPAEPVERAATSTESRPAPIRRFAPPSPAVQGKDPTAASTHQLSFQRKLGPMSPLAPAVSSAPASAAVTAVWRWPRC